MGVPECILDKKTSILLLEEDDLLPRGLNLAHNFIARLTSCPQHVLYESFSPNVWTRCNNIFRQGLGTQTWVSTDFTAVFPLVISVCIFQNDKLKMFVPLCIAHSFLRSLPYFSLRKRSGVNIYLLLCFCLLVTACFYFLFGNGHLTFEVIYQERSSTTSCFEPEVSDETGALEALQVLNAGHLFYSFFLY